MPSNTHKSAAVPFVNQKGERSMKRVKVERYVAGKKPAYAKEEEEDEEYYTTDDELEGEEDEYQSDEEADEEPFIKSENKRVLSHHKEDSESSSDEEEEEGREDVHKSVRQTESIQIESRNNKDRVEAKQEENNDDDDDDDEEDDPRFRRLKQIEESKPKVELISVQRAHQIQPKHHENLIGGNIVIEEEEEDEEEIRQRHALARRRQIEDPLGPQAIFGDLQNRSGVSGQHLGGNHPNDNEDDDLLIGDKQSSKRRLDTDDLLKDFKLTGLGPALLAERGPIKSDEQREAERRKLKEALEQARQEVKFEKQLNKRVEDDLRREQEREALAKGDIGAREMSAVVTDDEDDELAYEEWKLREIKRVLRDRSERKLECR